MVLKESLVESGGQEDDRTVVEKEKERGSVKS